ncbi:MAG: transposase, partial [Lewinella sp.]|nr:transposase [Lewinella sp.]
NFKMRALAHAHEHELQQRLKQMEQQLENGAPASEAYQWLHWQYFLQIERQLDQENDAPRWLEQPAIAGIVIDAWKFTEKHFGTLVHAVSVMPNHVHAVIRLPETGLSLQEIMQRHKGFTARQANTFLGRNGSFWQPETFDRVVRPGKLPVRIAYTLHNPVKAGLVQHPLDWTGTYLAEDWMELLE